MDKEDFMVAGEAAGFDGNQLEFMWEHLAKFPHTHTIDEVDELEEALDELGEDEEDGEEIEE